MKIQRPMESWHKEVIVYQIYPRSFCDSNGDGIGDLRGIISKLDYIQSLGVNAVWLNPIYKSPNDDGGYDISDYYSIQPEFGTMQDFDELLAGLHHRKIKLITDLVLNHTSDEHPWFQQSQKSKENPFRDFYFWKTGKDSSPPNNWNSFFGGSAWQFDESTNEYYLHLFSKKQPDLNWESPAVREELKKVIRFWLDKGVDGLRLDSITTVSKRVDFPNATTSDFNDTVRQYYSNGPRLKEFISELRQDIFNKYSVVTVGEGPGILPENALDYLGEKDGLSMIFHFGHMFIDQGPGGRFDPKPWTLKDFKEIFNVWDKTFSDHGWGSIFLGNHDFSRMVSRWGNDNEYREQSAKLLITLLLTLRGTPFVFQGDEIGMTNLTLKSIAESSDIETINGWREAQKKGESESDFLRKVNFAGRDNARTPLQWNDKLNGGFTTGTAWMTVNSNHERINVSIQENDPASVLNYFKEMTRLRKEHLPFTKGDYRPIETKMDDLFLYSREMPGKKIIVALNISSNKIDMPEEIVGGKRLIGNYDPGHDQTKMRPWEAIVFKV